MVTIENSSGAKAFPIRIGVAQVDALAITGSTVVDSGTLGTDLRFELEQNLRKVSTFTSTQPSVYFPLMAGELTEFSLWLTHAATLRAYAVTDVEFTVGDVAPESLTRTEWRPADGLAFHLIKARFSTAQLAQISSTGQTPMGRFRVTLADPETGKSRVVSSAAFAGQVL